jgi:phosphonopyruvate decarboxylase
MIAAQEFLAPLSARGFAFFTGVPCSFLTPLINAVLNERAVKYVGAASEGEAVALAAGAWLAGRATVVMCQNSGLGNAINPLTSLNHPFRIPTLLLVTWRGEPGLQDEPQHRLMGEITAPLLDTIRVAHAPFPDDAELVGEALDRAVGLMAERQLPYAFIVPRDAVRDSALKARAPKPPAAGRRHELAAGGRRPRRVEALARLLALVGEEAAVIATTGKTGRELFTLADRVQHLYQVGSMGGALPMGLGVALNAKRPVVVLDGDGAALMKLGAFATVGAQAPANLTHIVLDNGVHDSTGGQPTVSAGVDFARIAVACGYRAGYHCDTLAGFERAWGAVARAGGPSLIHLRIRPGSLEKLGRPTVTPPEVARRFRAFVTGA